MKSFAITNDIVAATSSYRLCGPRMRGHTQTPRGNSCRAREYLPLCSARIFDIISNGQLILPSTGIVRRPAEYPYLPPAKSSPRALVTDRATGCRSHPLFCRHLSFASGISLSIFCLWAFPCFADQIVPLAIPDRASVHILVNLPAIALDGRRCLAYDLTPQACTVAGARIDQKD